MLPFASALQLLEAITGWNPEVVEILGGVEDQQLPVRNPLKVGAELADVLAVPDELGLPVRERLDHTLSITQRVISGKDPEF